MNFMKCLRKNLMLDSVNIPDQRGNYRETLRVNDDLIKTY